MKNVIIERQIKEADINVKSDFSTNAIQEKIIDEAHKSLPLLKNLSYALDIKNKDLDAGNLFGVLSIDVPTRKNPQGKIKINLPIFIHDYKMKPIDTIVKNNVAFPINDAAIKELLNDPENFRTVSSKEIKQSRILSKLAHADPKNLKASLDDFIEETTDETCKLLAITQLRGLEELERIEKAAEDYSEPLMECILEKNASNNFDLYYTKLQGGNQALEFIQEEVTPETARALINAMGYNNEKIAEKATKKKGLHLKAPLYQANQHESLLYDPSKIDKLKMVESLDPGPCEIMSESGEKAEGLLYNLNSITTTANPYPEGKLFLDYDKNFSIATNFQGMPTENNMSLIPDNESIGARGVYVDEINDIAYGPLDIISYIKDGPDSKIIAKYKNKKFEFRKLSGIKTTIVDGNTITIPNSFVWYEFKHEIKLVSNPGEQVANKFAEESYKIAYENNVGVYNLTPVKKGTTKLASIPSDQHLRLFLSRINLMVDDFEKVADTVKNGRNITFITDYEMKPVFSKYTPTEKKETSFLSPQPQVTKYVDEIKIASEQLTPFFVKFFDLVRDQDFIDSLGITETDILSIDESLPSIKEASAFETLDSIFSLNVINTANSSIFLQSIDRLKMVLSLLSALRIYLRFGWDVGINETDVNQAVDAINEIVRSLELVKTQKLLERDQKIN
jgi:hypothetical protein